MADQRYTIHEQLGAGGNGAVFRAYDTQLKRWVAIKRLLTASEANSTDPNMEELRREADMLASLRNANIVTIFDVGSDAEGLFMVMELLEGPDLSDTIAHGPMMLDDFKQLAEQTLEALLAAHNLRILHRDIKPENIKVERLPGGRLQAKIIDFGLARTGLAARKQTEDQEGSVMGSIHYMAPEQLAAFLDRAAHAGGGDRGNHDDGCSWAFRLGWGAMVHLDLDLARLGLPERRRDAA